MTTGAPLLTDCGTTTSLGMRASALSCSVRSTSGTSSLTFELARLRTRRSFSIGVLSSRRVCSPIFTFLMLGMSIPATRSTSSLTSMRPRTTSLKYAGVSTTTKAQNFRSSAPLPRHRSGRRTPVPAGPADAWSPEGVWVTRRLSNRFASRLSSTRPRRRSCASGANLSMTAMSPNWRSASTRQRLLRPLGQGDGQRWWRSPTSPLLPWWRTRRGRVRPSSSVARPLPSSADDAGGARRGEVEPLDALDELGGVGRGRRTSRTPSAAPAGARRSTAVGHQERPPPGCARRTVATDARD